MIAYRKATHLDLPVLVSLDREYFPDTAWPAEQFRAEISGKTRNFLIAESEGEIIGYASAFLASAGGVTDLMTIAVHPDFRRQGIAQHLIAQLEKERSPKLAAYAVEYHGLIAGVVGPLIVIAIAIPFAVSGVRVNPAVGVSKSIGLFFLYYVMSTLANSLGARGTVDPMLAAWLPNAGMVAIAGWFLLRLR